MGLSVALFQTRCRRWYFVVPAWPAESYYLVVDDFGDLVRVVR